MHGGERGLPLVVVGMGLRRRRALSTQLTCLIAISIHLVHSFTIFVAHIEPCSIILVEYETPSCSYSYTTYIDSLILA
jgi:hypothetical protein